MFQKEDIKFAMSALTWGTMEMEGEVKIEATAKQMMDEVRLSGFDGIEAGMGFSFNDPQKLRMDLEKRGLVIPSLWYSGTLISEPYDIVEKKFCRYLGFLEAIGTKIINYCEQSYTVQNQLDKAVVQDRYIMNDEEWKLLLEGLDKLGEIANQRGFKITYHHHGGTVVMTESDVDRLMEGTDPEKIYLLLDTGHLVLGGGDPVSVAKKYGDRIGNVHLKDFRKKILDKTIENRESFGRALRNGIFTVPGDGDYCFPELFAVLSEKGYKGWLIVESEQDPEVYDPLDYAFMARNYLKETIGF